MPMPAGWQQIDDEAKPRLTPRDLRTPVGRLVRAVRPAHPATSLGRATPECRSAGDKSETVVVRQRRALALSEFG